MQSEEKQTSVKTKFTVREIATIPIFAALTAVLAQIAIPLPFSPVPISFGLVAVYITGILLKPSNALWAQICYLALGAIGIPVFHNFLGGVGVLFGPTGGYLMVYPIIAWIVSMALNSKKAVSYENTENKKMVFLRAGVSICVAHLLLYLAGTIWLSIYTGTSFTASLALAVIPFIPLDIVKILFCVIAVVPFRFRLIKLNLLQLNNQ